MEVKDYVYGRYSGIKSLSKLNLCYAILNEMTKCGLRSRLGLPSIYFYPAIFEALGDIKAGRKQRRMQFLRAKGVKIEELFICKSCNKTENSKINTAMVVLNCGRQ